MTKTDKMAALLCLLLAACSGGDGMPGADGASCTVTQEGGAATVRCEDGTTATVMDGADGDDGEDGRDGRNGTDGEDGEPGDDGVPGEPGDDGEDAESGVAETYLCSGELGEVGNAILSFTYHAAVLGSGDVVATGSVRTQSVGASDTRVYAEGEPGAPTAAVYPGIDLASGGGGFEIQLDREELAVTVRMRESESGPVAETWELPPTACSRSEH